MVNRTNSIPILLLTGFLGVGKTSLLNNLLKNTDGLKVGVIVNDFGKVNIDAMLVSAQTDTQIDLSNGCICCSVGEGELDDAISQLAHKGSLLDYIVIEASGLAEPGDLATVLRLMKNEYAHFDSVVTVVDALNFAKNNKVHATALENLSLADIIVINKVDLVSKKEVEDIEQGIAMVAPKARTIRSVNGVVDTKLLLESGGSQKDMQLSLSNHHSSDHSHDDHEHLHDTFTSVSFETTKPLDPVAFEGWAKDLPSNIFRAKGVCFFGMKGVGQKYIFQAVGKRYELKLDEWAGHEQPKTSLVVIGKNLDEASQQKQLESLVDDTPDDINADNLMDIFKYK